MRTSGSIQLRWLKQYTAGPVAEPFRADDLDPVQDLHRQSGDHAADPVADRALERRDVAARQVARGRLRVDRTWVSGRCRRRAIRSGAAFHREHRIGAADHAIERRFVHRLTAADRPLGRHRRSSLPRQREPTIRIAAAAVHSEQRGRPRGTARPGPDLYIDPVLERPDAHGGRYMHVDRRLLGWGLFFVLLGAIPLAVRAGLLDKEIVAQWPLLWPVLLIGWGLGLLLRGTPLALIGGAVSAITFGMMGGGAIATGFGGRPVRLRLHQHDAGDGVRDARPATSARTARADLVFNCGTSRSTPPTAPAGASRAPIAMARARRSSRTAGPAVGEVGHGSHVHGRRRARDLERDAAPRSRLAFGLTLNAGEGNLDLAGASISTVSMTLNAGSIDLDLGGTTQAGDVNATVNAGSAAVSLPAGDRAVNLSLNAGSLTVCVPAGTAIRAQWSGALGSNNFTAAGLDEGRRPDLDEQPASSPASPTSSCTSARMPAASSFSSEGPAVRERLYRSRDDRMLFGVAGGMAEWMDLDPAVVRLVWALLILAGGVGLLLYIVAAIVIPEAPLDAMGAASGAAGVPGDTAAANQTRWEARQARRAARGQNPGNAGMIFGLVLVLAGAWFLIDRYVPARYELVHPGRAHRGRDRAAARRHGEVARHRCRLTSVRHAPRVQFGSIQTQRSEERDQMFLFSKPASMPKPGDALPGPSRPDPDPAPAHGARHADRRAVPGGLRDRRVRARLLLGRGEDVLAAARASGRPRSATRVATRPTRPTQRRAPARPATPRRCASCSIRRRRATSSCSRSSGRTTTRRRACARATTRASQYRSAIFARDDAPARRGRGVEATMYQEQLTAAGLRTDHDRDRRAAGARVLLRRGLPPAVPRQESRAAIAPITAPA